ncbi:protein AF-10-like isoform X4 [Hypanus sabinus]|uniref:protein AF-10-like isoform X4 n=1 Tax=Hypanus sabinus TaxID=79690 RepID=UPI0028C45526|nr:protein AF-10-like isoform X4 [Hypanus sabinus]
MKEMVGGCCVCSDERGWDENPLVYCDGHGCNVAVHQACYGIIQVPTGPWFCRKCESQERAARVRCELCPHKDGALKRTDNGGWAHVVCALYVPEVQFANVISMEPIVLQYVPHERFNKTCYLCEEQGRESKAATGACMTCNRHGCRQAFHVTCAQMAGLLCEEQGSEIDNVKYCGYCKYHFNKVKKCRHSANTSYDQGLSDSSSHSQDKLSSLYDRQRKSRKDRERPKQKVKKATESLSTVVSSVSVTTEKTCTSTSGSGSSSSSSSSRAYKSGTARGLDEATPNFASKHFQRPSTSLVSGKETAEVARSEVKSKKASSHGSSQRGRKPGGGGPKSTATVATVSSPSLFQQGIYANKEMPLSLSGGVLGVGCSTPLSSNILPHHRAPHMMHLSRPSLPTCMAATASISSTQVFSLPGSSYNLAPSNVFGGPITPGSSISSLLNPVESGQAEPDLDDNDCSFVCRDSSSRGSLSPTSPIGGLSMLYNQTITSQLENVPQTTSNIEELLDKHWSGEGGIDIVDMLKSLHLLQLDNRRLQEQIMSLSAKKERLQLLNVQLSVPFASVTSTNGPSSQAHLMSSQNACSSELLNSSKSPPSKSSFITENSLSASSEDLHSGCHSRSSSSSSLQSTPPPALPLLQQSPVSLQLPGMAGISQPVNGLARTCVGNLGSGVSTATTTFSSTPMMTGMMGGPLGSQLASNGIVGPLNGVSQSSASVASIHNSLAHTSAPINVPPTAGLCHSSVSGLGQISDQQRQFLYQQQQQQLQQLLTSQQLTPDQQALVYQMMQQQQQQQRQREFQRLQMSGASQLPVNNLAQASPSLPVHSDPDSYISLHTDNSAQKAQRLNDKVNQDKS